MASRNHPTIIELLKADHREVDKLFAEFEQAEGNTKKQMQLASRIGQALTIHAEIEENLFYPTVLPLLDEEGADLTWEAAVEHGTLRGLIAGMNGGDPSQPIIKAHVTVLKEYVQHHVREEEKELFPRVQQLDLDLQALGAEMLELKEGLTAAAAEPDTNSRTIRITDVSVRDVAAWH